jgi:MSHA biogenesis protein MshK
MVQQTHHQLKLLLIVIFGMSTLLAIHIVQAEALKDPTLPPASLYNSATDGDLDVGPVLQSVMIGPQYRAAIISGKKVLLGKKYEEATLIRLNEHEAVLRNPDMTTQTLVMDYAIEKKIVLPTTTKKVKRSTKSK